MKCSMKSLALILVTFAGGVFSSACSPSSPPLQSTPQVDPEAATLSAPVSKQAAFSRKVDILFVIDTSESMVRHQENLKANIDHFVDSFRRHFDVDFHIGIVSIWDSIRYNKIVTEPYGLGKLRPLKGLSDSSLLATGPQFITRETDRYVEVLGESLKVGIEPRYVSSKNKDGRLVFAQDADGKLIDDGGPEFEELFSPVLPALSGQNAGFYRPDAHLAVVMITDADDSTPDLTADLLARKIFDLKAGDQKLVSGYAALALDGCAVDPGREVRDAQKQVVRVNSASHIIDFVQRTGGTYFNLCDEKFGEGLGAIGRLIEEKTESQMRIKLRQRPDISTLRVSYVVGGRRIMLTPGENFSYVEDANEILIRGNSPAILSFPAGEIKIDFTPINWSRYKSGHVKRVTGQ